MYEQTGSRTPKPAPAQPGQAAAVAMQQLAALERERDSLRTSMRNLEEQLADHKSRSVLAPKLQAQLKMVQQRFNEAAEEVSRLRGQVKTLNAEVARLNEVVADRDRAFEQQCIAMDRAQAHGAAGEALKKEHLTVTSRTAALEKELASLRVQLSLKDQLLQQMDLAEQAGGDADSETEKLRERLAMAEDRKVEAEGQILRSREEATAARDRAAELEAELKARDEQIDALKARLREGAMATESARGVRAENIESRSRIAELESLAAIYKKHADRLATKLEQIQRRDADIAQRNEKLQRDLGRIRAEVEVAVQDETRRRELGVICDVVDREIASRGGTRPASDSSAEIAIAAVRLDIPGHTIIDMLGTGSMGTVYKATQIALDRTVALKVLHEKYAHDQALSDSFIHEARATAQLSHPNLVSVYTVGRAGQHYYFTMEYVEGVTLGQVLYERVRLDVIEALMLGVQAARGLDHAHRSGIIHRDIKPENLMINNEGVLKIGDLGIAKSLSQAQSGARGEFIAGSPNYMAPEQALTGRVDLRADIYGLGATLYHALAGRPPIDVETHSDLIKAHARPKVASVTLYAPKVPPEVAVVLDRMIAKKPEDRYPSMAEVAHELERVMADVDDPLRPDAPAGRRTPKPRAKAKAKRRGALDRFKGRYRR